MNIFVDGDRSRRFVAFAKKKLQLVKDLSLRTKTLVLNGYTIHVRSDPANIGDIIRITAPPGAIVVDYTSGAYNYRYADQYGAPFKTLASYPAASNYIPLTIFGTPAECVNMATTDNSLHDGFYFTQSFSWPAYRPAGTGYAISGLYSAQPNSGTVKPIGYAFSRGNALFVSSTPTQRGYTDLWGTANITDVWAVQGSGLSYGLVDLSTVGGWAGKAFFTRPKWGDLAAYHFSFHADKFPASCSGIGASQVRVHKVTYTPQSSNLEVTQVAVITHDKIAAALGLDDTCYTGGFVPSETAVGLMTLLYRWLDTSAGSEPTWPRGVMFSYGADAVCCLGFAGNSAEQATYPTGPIKGVIFSADGTVAVVPMGLPSYDATLYYPRIVEVSPSIYRCEVVGCHGFSNSSEVSAVYYGTPVGTGTWVALAHPAGALLRHRTILATPHRVVALAVVYDGSNTYLHSYDSSTSPVWNKRGKIGVGKVTHPDVAVFGQHEYAASAALDSPLECLWQPLSSEQ